MTDAELEVALQAAFEQCEALSCPLNPQQQSVFLQLVELLAQQGLIERSQAKNPLDELTPEQRRALLQFVKDNEEADRPWKVELLNDWLNNRDSGPVQFIRNQYGMQWLEQVTPAHLAQYAELENGHSPQLKIGDRIEVCNRLWEWVQEDGPCQQEWFLCTVINIVSSQERELPNRCTIRFDNGSEYEIQGMYEWNRYNWRWPQF